MHLRLSGGLPRCLVIAKSYGDIKTRGRYSVRCRRPTNRVYTTQTRAGTAFLGTVLTSCWELTCSLDLHQGNRSWTALSPYNDFQPLLAVPNFAPLLSILPSPSLPRNGGPKPSSLLLASKPRQASFSTTALLWGPPGARYPCTRGWAHASPVDATAHGPHGQAKPPS